MFLKEILVHLDHTPRCQARLDVAISLAQKHRAHLTGLFATSHPYFAARRTDSQPALAEAESLFRQKAAQAEVAADWLNPDPEEVMAGVADRVILHAYYADLVILGQADPGSGGLSVPFDLPERVALGAGRPVLVVPHSGEFKSVGERVMVAWRGGRASSRALNDAIPFLVQAQQIHLMMVNPLEHFEQEARNLCTYLARHGIKATSDRLSANEVRAGDILLNQACDLGIDLMVLGVFSHRRLGKKDLGPVGRHFLEHMTIPVLMSR